MTPGTLMNHDDRLHEECGVFGVFGHDEAAALTALGLHALQHDHRALGLIGDNFNSEDVIKQLRGSLAVGHTRYSTSGETVLRNVQPLFADFQFGGLAIAHNGNLTNAYRIRRDLVRRGCIFQSTSDTEIIIHLIAISLGHRVVDRVTDALRQVDGAYSLVCITQKKLIGLRDPYGVRPLVLGRLEGAYILA
ncbi:MAG: amidophosphoribosyltransferase, partial [Rhodospirillales bacterium]